MGKIYLGVTELSKTLQKADIAEKQYQRLDKF